MLREMTARRSSERECGRFRPHSRRLAKRRRIANNVYGSCPKSMKAHSQHRPTTPHRVSPRLALVALIALVLQPLLLSLHGGTAFAHSHFEGQSPHHAHQETAAFDTHHDAHHDERVESFRKARMDARGHSEPSSPASPILSRASDHQHELCCSHGSTPFLRATLPLRSDSGEGHSLPMSQAAILMPTFKLHVLAGIHTRAGPPDTRPFSVRLASSLLGRAPPLSA